MRDLARAAWYYGHGNITAMAILWPWRHYGQHVLLLLLLVPPPDPLPFLAALFFVEHGTRGTAHAYVDMPCWPWRAMASLQRPDIPELRIAIKIFCYAQCGVAMLLLAGFNARVTCKVSATLKPAH